MLNPQKILICDDDDTIALVCNFFLEEKGFRTITARSCEECIKLIRAEPPDLILLDLNLPMEGGRLVAEELKNQECYIPVILMSGDVRVSSIAENLGAQGYLCKPFDLGDLEREVNKYLTIK